MVDLDPRLKRTALPFLAAAAGLTGVACGAPGAGRGIENTQDDQHKALDTQQLSPEIQAIVDTEDLLSDLLAFPMLPQYYDKIEIQQGWADHDASEPGLDLIYGKKDQSPWKEYVAAASATGRACIPTNKKGSAILIRNVIERLKVTLDIYYGHFKEIFLKDLPLCKGSPASWLEVKRRQPLGIVGADGVVDAKGQLQPGWKHLHFQINKISGNLTHGNPDGFGIHGTREQYPTIMTTAWGACGKVEALFAACYKGHPDLAKLVSESNPIPTKTNTPIPSPTNTPKPTETPIHAFKLRDKVEVYESGKCLNVRQGPTTSSSVLQCIPDGTITEIEAGPEHTDNYTWWKLKEPSGWSVQDSLRTPKGPTLSGDRPPFPPPSGPLSWEQTAKGFTEALTRQNFNSIKIYLPPDKQPNDWDDVFPIGDTPGFNPKKDQFRTNLTECSGIKYTSLERPVIWGGTKVSSNVSVVFDTNCIKSWEGWYKLRMKVEEDAMRNNTPLPPMVHPITGQVLIPKNDIERATFFASIPPDAPVTTYFRQLDMTLEPVNTTSGNSWFVMPRSVKVNKTTR